MRVNTYSLSLAVVGCLASWPALAQAPAESPVQPVGILGAPSGTGGSPAVAESDATLRTHVLYHPADLKGASLPLVVWGNGACADNGLGYATFLREVASHGYFVIALGVPRAERVRAPAPPPAAAAPPPQPAPGARVDPTRAEQMLEAIDWATKQRTTRPAVSAARSTLAAIAVMGHSCGGCRRSRPRQIRASIRCSCSTAV